MSEKNTTTGSNIQVNFDEVDDFKVLSGKPSPTSSTESPDLEDSQEEEEENGDEDQENEDDNTADEEGEEEEEENNEEDDENEEDDSDEDEDSADSASEEDEGELELDEDQAESVVEQRLGLSTAEIQQRLNELETLKKNPPTIKFPSEKHQKAYEFISKYSGDDFKNGIIRFAELSSLDVAKLNAKDAMKELFFHENPKLSREKAEKLFEHEFSQKYEGISDEDVAQTKIDLDGDKAKEKLAELQKETHTVKTENDNKQYDEFMTNYHKSVDDSLKDFESITLSIEGVPDSEFNFDFKNQDVIKDSMSDVENLFKNNNWVTFDENGKFKSYNFDKMRVDFAFLHNKEEILSSYFNHGKEAGRDELIREIENRTPKGKKPSNAHKGSPKTYEEAMEEAVMKLPEKRR